MPARAYAATFASGFERPVARLLTMGGAQQVKAEGGLALFMHPGAVDASFLDALFLIAVQGRAKDIAGWLAELTKRNGWLAKLPGMIGDAASFRIVTMQEGKLVACPPKLLSWLEDAVADVTGARSDRARPGIELWANVRSDGTALFMARITRRKPNGKALPQGALRPELCALLAAMSEVRRGDRALDPFAGRGGIAEALHGRGAEVVSGDADEAIVNALAALTKNKPGMSARKLDALDLPFEDGSFDAVVTDPPWGAFVPLPLSPGEFMTRAVGEMARVLRPHGRLVLLTALKDETSRALAALGFTFERHDVLINGKKAAMFDARRED